MNEQEQAQGEKRVRTMLVEPVMRAGLAKPSSLTRDVFDAMLDEVTQKLAYMTAENLGALAEQVIANPAGKDADRWPIAAKILEWAAGIQPPEDTGSPLLRALFGHRIGADALEGGWAPELLAEVKRTRRWPNAYQLMQLRERAAEPVQHARSLELRLGRGQGLSANDSVWLERRRAAIAKCRRIAELSEGAA